jgi:formiminotetrahydrofolate cyclodeaminase
MRMQRLRELTVAEFCEQVASTEPAPGGGAVGAAALAMGVACARKALAITLRRSPDAELTAADLRLAEIVREALDAGDRDSRWFAELMGAYRKPKDSPAEARDRSAEIKACAGELVHVGEQLTALGQEAAGIVERLRPRLAAALANDVAACLSLVEANRSVQADNLADNRRIAERT